MSVTEVKHGGPGPHETTGTPQLVHRSRWGGSITTRLPYDDLVLGQTGLGANELWDASDALVAATAKRLASRLGDRDQGQVATAMDKLARETSLVTPPGRMPVAESIETILTDWNRNAYSSPVAAMIRDSIGGQLLGRRADANTNVGGMSGKLAANMLVSAIYDETQETLAREGVDEFTAFRGQGVDAPRGRAVESWSADLGVATMFAGGSDAPDVDVDAGESIADVTDADRALLAQTVPRNRVFSLPSTGLGQATEAEVMVLPEAPVSRHRELVKALNDFGAPKGVLDETDLTWLRSHLDPGDPLIPSSQGFQDGFLMGVADKVAPGSLGRSSRDEDVARGRAALRDALDNFDVNMRKALSSESTSQHRVAERLMIASDKIRRRQGSPETFTGDAVELATEVTRDQEPLSWPELGERWDEPGSMIGKRVKQLATRDAPSVAAKKEVMRKVGARMLDDPDVDDEDVMAALAEFTHADADGVERLFTPLHIDGGSDTWWKIWARGDDSEIRAYTVPAGEWVDDHGNAVNHRPSLFGAPNSAPSHDQAAYQFERGVITRDEMRIIDPTDPYEGPTWRELTPAEAIERVPLNAPEPVLDKETGRRIAREYLTARFISQWAQSSNDRNGLSLALQEAVRDEFNLDPSVTAPWDALDEDVELTEEIGALHAEHGDVLRGFIRAQYDETQAWLAENGISRLELHRGFSFADRGSTPEWLRLGERGASVRKGIPYVTGIGDRERMVDVWLVEPDGYAGDKRLSVIVDPIEGVYVPDDHGDHPDIDTFRALLTDAVEDAERDMEAGGGADIEDLIADAVDDAFPTELRSGGDGTINPHLRPASAFSSSGDVAFSFASHDGPTIRAIVDAKHILGCPRSGVGCLSEHEFVVLSHPMEAERG